MNFNEQEGKIMHTLFKDVKEVDKHTVLCTLYAAKPERDGSPDAEAIIEIINTLITKVYNLEEGVLRTYLLS